jgi:flavin reductase (DIM6/NTAB) family NADH-FMN oxidoreductase RutF
MPAPDPSPIARALGRIPSGLFIATTEVDGRRSGCLVSFVMQAGLEPPIVSLAIARDRSFLDDVRRSGRFALSVLDERSRRAMTVFTRRGRADESPFDKLAISTTRSGLPVLDDALAWLEGHVRGEHATPDHVILFAEVVAAGVSRDGDPHVHLRRNGLGY